MISIPYCLISITIGITAATAVYSSITASTLLRQLPNWKNYSSILDTYQSCVFLLQLPIFEVDTMCSKESIGILLNTLCALGLTLYKYDGS